jgi:hypothetical protein
MRRALLAVAVMAAALFAAKLYAAETTASKPSSPDWHYRWHEGRWWYWMPESKSHWMVWMGSKWVSYEEPSSGVKLRTVSEPKSGSPGAGVVETQKQIASEPSSVGANCQPGYSAGYSTGSGGNYAGYGWTWGPGTAFRSGPGGRF